MATQKILIMSLKF